MLSQVFSKKIPILILSLGRNTRLERKLSFAVRFSPERVPNMKGALWGVNFGFWSHLRCSGKKAIIFSHEGLAKKYKYISLSVF